jgi:aerobic-type carbon monoxide dehydrogenase small subunit (CoxS/CutS family)
MAATHSLLVNDRRYQVSLDHYDTPLLYVLRNDLGLKGARFGCGTGDCGACAVLVDGHVKRSCETPVWSVEGKSITTIEGLGTIARLHPLQQAFLDFQAGQCGYCLSGIIMTALELVESGAEPSRQKIVDALNANLCRCGAHNRIVNAIEAVWKNRSRTRHG